MYDAGHGLFDGEPSARELGPVELVPGEAERNGRENRSTGFERADSNGEAVAVCVDLKTGWELLLPPRQLYPAPNLFRLGGAGVTHSSFGNILCLKFPPIPPLPTPGTVLS